MTYRQPTGYEHVPTIRDLEEVIGWMMLAEPLDAGHEQDLIEDLAFARDEVSRRRQVGCESTHLCDDECGDETHPRDGRIVPEALT